MSRFDIFFKNAGLSKMGNPRAYKEEFSTESYDKTFNTDNMPPFNTYHANGVSITESHNPIRLVYDGMLAKGGAQDIYAVVGYGDNHKWEDIEYYKMHRLLDGSFEFHLPIKREGNINIAFKDGANNWDNNFGENYTFGNHFKRGSH